MDKKSTWALIGIQWSLAFVWLQAGWEKFASPEFIDGIGKTIGTFAAKTTYVGYADFLKNTAIPSAEAFGNLVRIGEVGVGLALAIGGYLALRGTKNSGLAMWLLIVSLLLGAFLNLNFYLAASWTGPSTAGMNVLMGLIEIILAVYYILMPRRAN